ncbi:MAG: twin-arginine translocase subunit TatC [Hirschia sp.]|nr:twin-arginine translocase subunit TatC [Hirschia sp.]
MHEKGADEVEASRAPLAEHLSELRSRLMRVIAAIALCSIAAFMFSEHMIDFLMVPFARAKEAFGQENLIDGVFFDSAFEILFIKLRLSIMVGLAIAFPYVAWEIYAFVAPGLYQNERRAMLPYMIATPFLFAAGGALVYYVILPFIMRFAFGQEFEGVTFLPKAKPYVDLALSLLTAFGLAFQTPVVMSLLAQAEIVTVQGLRKGRKYALVVIFAIAMFMTPPDPFSQSALAVPVYLLYELGIIAAWLIERKRKKADEKAGIGTGAP